MKTLYNLFFALLITVGFCSCDDYLDREPSSTIPPEAYFKTGSLHTEKLRECIHSYEQRVL